MNIYVGMVVYLKIKSKIYGPWKNQYGSINHYLVLNKRDLPNP